MGIIWSTQLLLQDGAQAFCDSDWSLVLDRISVYAAWILGCVHNHLAHNPTQVIVALGMVKALTFLSTEYLLLGENTRRHMKTIIQHHHLQLSTECSHGQRGLGNFWRARMLASFSCFPFCLKFSGTEHLPFCVTMLLSLRQSSIDKHQPPPGKASSEKNLFLPVFSPLFRCWAKFYCKHLVSIPNKDSFPYE